MEAMITKLYSAPAFTAYTWISILVFALLRASWITESDILWQTRDGLDQLQQQHPTFVDQWSWMLHGEAWVPNSWLFNLLLGISFALFGPVGISLLSGLLVFLFFMLLKAVLEHIPNTTKPQRLGLLWVVGVVMFSWLSSRPQIIDYILILCFVLVALHIATRTYQLKKQIVLLTLIGFIVLLVWQNFHLTGVFGIICLAFIVFLTLSGKWWHRLIASTGFAIILVPALFATPYGWSGVQKTMVVSDASWGTIIEWMSIPDLWLSSISNHSGLMMSLLFTVQWVVGFWLCYIATTKKQWWLAAGLASLGVLSFIAVRFIPYFILFSILALLLSGSIGNSIQTQTSSHSKWKQYLTTIRTGVGEAFRVVGPVMVLFMLVISGVVFGYQQVYNSVISTPQVSTAVAQIPTSSRVLTLPANSGYMILTRRDLLVALDGRNDLYGRDRYAEVFILFDERTTPTDFNAFLEEYGVTTYFVNPARDLTPQDTRITKILDMLGWERVQVEDVYFYQRPPVNGLIT